MKITPLDIQQKQFQPTFRGFHQEEVLAFLDMVRIELEGLMRDNAQLKDEVRRLETELADYKERDKSIKDTLMTAQRMTEELRLGATKEAEILLSDARTQAEQIVANAHDRMLQILEEINDLKGQRARVLAGLRGTIETHAKLLEITEGELAQRDGIDEKLTYLKRAPRGLEQAP